MDTELPQSPTLSAEDIGRRVIKLVQNLRTLDDISPASLERQMGIALQFNAEDPNRYGFGGQLAGSWRYDVVTIPDRAGQSPRRLEFSIDDRSPNNDADMTPIQTLSFNDYRDALVAAGYSVKRLRGGRFNDAWMFTRDKVTVSIYMQRFQDPEKVTAYVRSLSVYFPHLQPTTQRADP